jgi:hypothetical protein
VHGSSGFLKGEDCKKGIVGHICSVFKRHAAECSLPRFWSVESLSFPEAGLFVGGQRDRREIPLHGGHCQRVPELTKMLAEAACATTASACHTLAKMMHQQNQRFSSR